MGAQMNLRPETVANGLKKNIQGNRAQTAKLISHSVKIIPNMGIHELYIKIKQKNLDRLIMSETRYLY